MKRSFLTGLGITDSEVIDKIINTYQAKVTDLSEEMKTLKKQNQDELQKQDDAKTKAARLEKKVLDLEQANKDLLEKHNTDLKSKDEELKTFKSDVEAKETRNSKLNFYKENLIKDGANPKLIDLLVKATDIDTLDLDIETKSIKNYNEVSKTLKDNYSDLFTTTTETVKADNPIASNTTNLDPFLAGFDAD